MLRPERIQAILNIFKIKQELWNLEEEDPFKPRRLQLGAINGRGKTQQQGEMLTTSEIWLKSDQSLIRLRLPTPSIIS